VSEERDRLAVLYDSECGFCEWTLALVLRWDRQRRLRPVAIQSPEGDALLSDVPAAQRLDAAHAIDPAGLMSSGGAAAAVVARQMRFGEPVARVAETFPALTDRVYGWVAEHRGKLSGAVPSASKRAARERIARH